jgi:DNA-directed RNA polymerase subunit H
MADYIPYIVYSNLVLMMGYRGVTTTSILDSNEVVKRLNHHQYVKLEGTRGPNDPRKAVNITLILIAPGSDYAAKSPNFRKLLKVPEPSSVRTQYCYISEYDLTSNIKKIIEGFSSTHGIYIEYYNYSKFLIDATKHVLVPPHTVATAQEVKDFCNNYYTVKENLPKINTSDTQAIWLGLLPGDCVKVTRISETAGTSIIYRVCVKG